jgi:integrase
MKGLIRKGKRFAYQAGIPIDVRSHFGGKKKYQKVFQTDDLVHAERLAVEADREFKSTILEHRRNALSGERLTPERQAQIAGWLFGQYFDQYQHDYFDLEESIKSKITEAYDDGFPLIQGLLSEGLVFDQIVRQIESMLEWSEKSRYARKLPKERPGAMLMGAYEAWTKRAQQRPKTIKMYGKSVREFVSWFELGHGRCYGTAIRPYHVNRFVSTRMHTRAAKATIMHDLSALRLIWKAGQFGEENPFSKVTDRMVIEGKKLQVRPFTDAEVQQLLAQPEDRSAIWIAAYSGMRLSEITSLCVSNVERAGRGYVFNLMSAGRRKTKAGYRKIPVHPVLLKEVISGLLRGRQQDEPLIGTVSTDTLSKRINRAIDRVTDDPSVRAHSFRHAFITKLAEAGCGKELRMAIAGHEGSDAHDRYTHADFLIELSRQIGKVRYG